MTRETSRDLPLPGRRARLAGAGDHARVAGVRSRTVAVGGGVAARALSMQVVDQAGIGTAPSGHQVVTRLRREASVAAAGDVVEGAAVVRPQANAIDVRVDEAHPVQAVLHRVLVQQRHVAGPTGRRETGSSPSSCTGTVVANVIVRV